MQETRMRYTKETEGVKDEQHAEDRHGFRPQERDRGRGERQGLLRVQGSCHPEEGKVKKERAVFCNARGLLPLLCA